MVHHSQSFQNYAPTGKWLWDPWFLKIDSSFHLFHLQAYPSNNPDERHHNSISIGHAISKSNDLKSWTTLPTALGPGVQGSWDESSLWTGSVLHSNNHNYLFYTGLSKKNNEYWVQRIGVAKAKDDALIGWSKKPDPILEADNHYYHMSNKKNALGVIPAFRDPYAFEHNGKYYLAFTARASGQEPEYNGCIGIAQSDDLINWKLLPPLLAPQQYDEMEVPQIIFHHNKWYLFFTSNAKYINQDWARGLGSQTVTSCYAADNLFANFQPVNSNGVVYSNALVRGLRLIERQSDAYTAVGWLELDVSNNFVGQLSNPMKVSIHDYTVTVE